MATNATVSPPHIPVGEYLGSVYRPDVDYVDGVLERRNVGEFDHAMLQRVLLFALVAFEGTEGVFALQEVRVQASPTRFRIPDVCLLPADKKPRRIVVEPPLLCVEVLSPRDSLASMRRRCLDYLEMGVPEVWIFDPEEETAFLLTKQSLVEVTGKVLHLAGTGISLDTAEVFATARSLNGRNE